MNYQDNPQNSETSSEPKLKGEETDSFVDLLARFDRWEPIVVVIATILLAIATLAVV